MYKQSKINSIVAIFFFLNNLPVKIVFIKIYKKITLNFEYSIKIFFPYKRSSKQIAIEKRIILLIWFKKMKYFMFYLLFIFSHGYIELLLNTFIHTHQHVETQNN